MRVETHEHVTYSYSNTILTHMTHHIHTEEFNKIDDTLLTCTAFTLLLGFVADIPRIRRHLVVLLLVLAQRRLTEARMRGSTSKVSDWLCDAVFCNGHAETYGALLARDGG